MISRRYLDEKLTIRGAILAVCLLASAGCSSDLQTGTGSPSTTTISDDLAEYYLGIGVADDRVECIVASLAEIGVVTTAQLEGSEQVTSEIARRIDTCLAAGVEP